MSQAKMFNFPNQKIPGMVQIEVSVDFPSSDYIQPTVLAPAQSQSLHARASCSTLHELLYQTRRHLYSGLHSDAPFGITKQLRTCRVHFTISEAAIFLQLQKPEQLHDVQQRYTPIDRKKSPNLHGCQTTQGTQPQARENITSNIFRSL